MDSDSGLGELRCGRDISMYTVTYRLKLTSLNSTTMKAAVHPLLRLREFI